MLTRRSFVAAGGTALATMVPFADWLGHASAALASTKLTRHDVTTAEGQAMLKIYARAVGKMMDTAITDPGNPLGWLFQWYTHAVPGNGKSKASEIQRIYKSDTDPNKALASKMWNTCEAHFDSSRADFFLPWHRLFVMYFERIIRRVSEEPSFTLPYWNYTGADPANRILPEQFRRSSVADWKSLFRRDRKRDVNRGVPVDQIAGASQIDVDAMQSTVYQDTEGDAGFCSNTDNNPHGTLHVDVGTSRGMGQIPRAANDPIFWLHHCNIDRMWASWNKAGGKNPDSSTFKNEPFTFADADGHEVQGTVGDVLELNDLDYDYDSYINRPQGSPPFSTVLSPVVAFSLHGVSRRVSGPIALGASPTSVTLAAETSPQLVNPQFARRDNLDVQLQTLGFDRTFYLRLNDVTASAAPGVGYDVYLDPAGPKNLNHSDPSYVGPLSFFGAAPHGEHADHAAPSRATGRNYSFIVTDHVRHLKKAGQLSREPEVTLVPRGAPSEGSAPRIGSVSLVSAT